MVRNCHWLVGTLQKYSINKHWQEHPRETAYYMSKALRNLCPWQAETATAKSITSLLGVRRLWAMGIFGHKTFTQLPEYLASAVKSALKHIKGLSLRRLPPPCEEGRSRLIILISQMREVGSLMTKSLASSQTASKGWDPK